MYEEYAHISMNNLLTTQEAGILDTLHASLPARMNFFLFSLCSVGDGDMIVMLARSLSLYNVASLHRGIIKKEERIEITKGTVKLFVFFCNDGDDDDAVIDSELLKYFPCIVSIPILKLRGCLCERSSPVVVFYSSHKFKSNNNKHFGSSSCIIQEEGIYK